MSPRNPSQATSRLYWLEGGASILFLAVVLAVLFSKIFSPGYILFANDAPLGVVTSESFSAPSAFTGVWLDLVWIGNSAGYWLASPSYVLCWLFGPVGFAKFYDPVSLLLLGICSWIFFRSLGLSSALCGVGTFAAALNSNFFSTMIFTA